MPVIPQYERQVGTPRNVPRTDTFQAQRVVNPAEGIVALGSAVANVVQTENNRREEQALTDYDLQLSQADQKAWLGDDQTPGAAATQGRNAAGVTARTLADWDKQADALAPKLNSPEAQARAQQRRAVRRQDLQARLAGHELQQGKVADAQTFDAAKQTYANEAVAGADDPAAVDASLARGRGAIAAYGKRSGWDEQTTINNLADWESGALRGAIASQLTRDPLKALATFKQRVDTLKGPDRIAVESALRPYVLDANSRKMGESLYQAGAPTVAAGTPLLYDAIALTESGDKQFDSTGAVIRGPATASGARAVGRFQIMPATGPEAAKLAGLPWDAKKFESDETYHAQLGRAYIDAQVERFGGNVPVVAAAYNMGPEAAAAWAAGKPYKTASGKQWNPKGPMDPEALPTETRDYIAKVTARMGGTPEVAPASADPETMIAHKESDALRRAYMIENPDDRQAVMQDIRTRAGIDRLALQESDRAAQAGKAALVNQYQNVTAKLRDGVMVPIADRPSRETMVAAFGEAEGGQRYDQMQAYADRAPDMAQLPLATPQQAATILDKYKPKADSKDYAFDSQSFGEIQTQWKAVQAQRNADPAGFLASQSPAIASRAQDLGQAQQDWANAKPEDRAAAFDRMQFKGEAYAAFVLSEQARLGVPANQRKLIPNGTANALNAQFEASLAKGDVESAVNTLRSSVALFGDAGIHVIPQLGKDASPLARFALEGIDTRTIQTLAAVQAQGGDEVLKKAIGEDAHKSVSEAVRVQLAAFDATNSTEYPIYYDNAVRLAAAKVRGGLTIEQAAQQASSELINGRYDFGGQGTTITYRVPKADPQGGVIDTVSVKAGASRQLAVLSPADISITDPLPPGVDENEYKQWRVRYIQRTGKWLNDGSESGLVLAIPDDSGRLVSVRDAKGKPILRSWAELAATPKPSAADANAGHSAGLIGAGL